MAPTIQKTKVGSITVDDERVEHDIVITGRYDTMAAQDRSGSAHSRHGKVSGTWTKS